MLWCPPFLLCPKVLRGSGHATGRVPPARSLFGTCRNTHVFGEGSWYRASPSMLRPVPEAPPRKCQRAPCTRGPCAQRPSARWSRSGTRSDSPEAPCTRAPSSKCTGACPRRRQGPQQCRRNRPVPEAPPVPGPLRSLQRRRPARGALARGGFSQGRPVPDPDRDRKPRPKTEVPIGGQIFRTTAEPHQFVAARPLC